MWRWLLVAWGTVLAVALSGCGANISTTFTMGSSTSGSRVMTLSLSASDLARVPGGTKPLDASIRAHEPSQLSYSGISTAPDGSISATFTIAFISVDEYRAKVAAILQAGGVATTPQITFQAPDANNPFRQGGTIQENFTSKDLMAWLPQGLVADGLISPGDASDVLGGKISATVVVNGKTQTASDPLNVTATIDSGFSAIDVRTDYTAGPGTIQRVITYSADSSKYAANPTPYDTYLTSATPSGAQLVKQPATPQQQTWTLTFTADAPSDIVSMTNHALDSTAAVFSPTWTPASGQPMADQVSVAEYVECSAVCLPNAQVTDELVVPSTWKPSADTQTGQASGAGTSYDVSRPGGKQGAPIGFTAWLPVAGVSATTTVGTDGNITQTITFQVAAANDAANQARYLQGLTPPAWVGSLVRTSAQNAWNYVVTVTASSAQDYTQKMADYLPGTRIAMQDAGGFFRVDRTLSATLDLSGLFSGGTAPGISQTLTVGALERISTVRADEGATPAVAPRSATVTVAAGSPGSLALTASVSGWTVRGLVVLSVCVVVLLAVGVALLVLRRRGLWWGAAPKSDAAADVAPRIAPSAGPSAVPEPTLPDLQPPMPVPTVPPPVADNAPVDAWTRMPSERPTEMTMTMISPFARLPIDVGSDSAPAGTPPADATAPEQPDGDGFSPYAPGDVDFGPGAGMGQGLDEESPDPGKAH